MSAANLFVFVPVPLVAQFDAFVNSALLYLYETRDARQILLAKLREFVRLSSYPTGPGLTLNTEDYLSVSSFLTDREEQPTPLEISVFVHVMNTWSHTLSIYYIRRLIQTTQDSNTDEPEPTTPIPTPHAEIEFFQSKYDSTFARPKRSGLFEAQALADFDPKELDHIASVGLSYIINALAGQEEIKHLEIFLDLVSQKLPFVDQSTEILLWNGLFRSIQAYLTNLQLQPIQATQVFLTHITTKSGIALSSALSSYMLALTIEQFSQHVLDQYRMLCMRLLYENFMPSTSDSLEAQMFRTLVGKEDIKMIEEMNYNLGTIGPKIMERMEKLQPSFDKIATAAEGIQPSVEQFTDSFAKFTDSIESIKKPLLANFGTFSIGSTITMFTEKIVGFIATCIAMYRTTDVVLRGMIGLIFASTSGVLSSTVEVIARLINISRSITAPEPGLVAQGFEGMEENAFVALVSVFTNMFSATDVATKKLDSIRIATVKSYFTMFKLGKDFVQFIVNLSQEALYYIYEQITGCPYAPDDETKLFYQQVGMWLEKVHALSEQEISTHRSNAIWRKNFNIIYKEGQLIEQFISDKQLTNGRIAIFTKLMRTVEATKDKVDLYLKSDKGRSRPVVVFLKGKSGVGKSNLVDFLINDLAYLHGLPYSKANKYPLEPDRKFMDGYDNQFAVVIDDFMQLSDTAIQTECALSIIKLANDATFLTNQASLDGKGTVFFDSPLMILTSNIDNTPKLNLTSVDAYKRRRDFVVEVSIDAKHKLPPNEPFSRERYVFNLWDSVDEKKHIGKYTYPELIALIFQLMKERTTEKGSLSKYLETAPIPDFLQGMKLAAQMLKTEVSSSKSEEDPHPKHEGTETFDMMEENQILNYAAKVQEYLTKANINRPSRGIKSEQILTQEYRDKAYRVYLGTGMSARLAKLAVAHDTQRAARLVDFKTFSGSAPETVEEKLFKLKTAAIKSMPDVATIKSHAADSFNDVVDKFRKTVTKLSVSIKEAVDTFLKISIGIAHNPTQLAGIILTVAGLLGSVATVAGLYHYFKTEDEPLSTQIGGSDVYDPTINNSAQKKKAPYKKRPITVATQVAQSLDNSTNNLIASTIKNNMISIRIGSGEVKGLFIKGRTFVTVKHIFVAYPNSPMQIIGRGNVLTEIPCEEFTLTPINQNDQMYVTINSKTFQNYPDISHHFILESDIAALEDSSISLVVKTGESNFIRTSSRPSNLTGQVSYDFRSKQRMQFTNADTLLVPVESYLGDCGSPYVINNTRIPRKLIGIHIAGGTAAACTLITQEDLAVVGLLENKIVAQSLIIGQLLPVTDSQIPLDAFETPNVHLIGCVPSTLQVRQPGLSEIRKTAFHNKWQPALSQPAMLKKDRKTGISPFHVGLKKKLIRPANNYASPHEDILVEFLASKIPTCVIPRVLTISEAINGVTEYSHLKAIDRSTSAGWPYNTEPHKLKGKLDHLIYDPDTDLYSLTPRVAAALDQLINKHKTHTFGEPHIVVCDNLKDECLPHEKVEEVIDGVPTPVGNSRIMNSLPLEALVEERMFFGSFFENMLRWQSTGKSFCDLGINPDTARSWSTLASKLKRFVDARINAGDLKKQDASTPAFLAKLFGKVVRKWYSRGNVTEEELTIMEHLHDELSEVLHIAINLIYRATGNPSGRFLTTIQNGFVTAAVFLDTILDMIDAGEVDLTQQEGLELVISNFNGFGDDHLHFVEKDFPLDMFKVRDQFKKYGMDYTGIYKTRPLVASYDPSEVKYLQRFFNDVEGTIHGALDKDVIEEIVYWKKDGQMDETALPVLVDSALRHAYHWGKTYFTHLKTKYNNALAEIGIPPVTLQFGDLHRSFHGIATFNQPLLEAQMSTSLSEKAEVTNPVSTTIATTTFNDNVGKQEGKKETPIVITALVNQTDPYEDQGLKQVLSRPYPVKSFEWSSTDISGSFLEEITFPKALYDIPNISAKLDRFQYLQAAIRCSLRINTTSMHAGKLLVAWTPHWKDNGTQLPFQNIYTASTINHSILSANTTVSLDWVIPFVGPSNYWNLKDDPATTAKGFMGTVQIFVLHPLTLLGTTTPVIATVTLYASFVDPRPAGLGLRTIATDLYAQMQDSSTREGQTKSDTNSIANIAKSTANTMFSTIVKPFLPNQLQGVGSMLMDVATDALGALFLDKPTSTQAVQKVTISQSTSVSHTRGLDGAELLSANPENHVSTDFSMYCTPKDYNLFENYKLLPGLVMLGEFDYTNAIGYKPFIIPISPTFCHTEDLTTAIRYYTTPVGHLASFFRFWRGGMKFHIKFTCNKFTTTRVRLTWLPDPTFTASFAANEEGDTVNRIIDITGDTSTSVVVPYLKDTYWAETVPPATASELPVTYWPGFNGQLVLSIVNPVTGASDLVGSKVYYAVWMSAAEDFQVSRPTELWNDYVDGTETEIHLEAQMQTSEEMDMRAVFRNGFEPLVPATTCIPKNIQMGETVDSWPELLKRYTYYDTMFQDLEHTINPWTWNVTVGTRPSQWYRIVRAFLFSRGSIRYKFIGAQNVTSSRAILLGYNTTQDETYSLEYAFTRGTAYTDTTMKGTLEVQTPYYSKYNMQNASYDFEQDYQPMLGFRVIPQVGLNNYTGYFFISAGDDFTLGYPSCPIVLQTAVTATKTGGNQPGVPRLEMSFSSKNDNNSLSEKLSSA